LAGTADEDQELQMSAHIIHCDPEIMGGTPVFVGTRVPARTLFDYLAGGHPIDEFLDDFPTVSRDEAVGALQQAMAAVHRAALADAETSGSGEA
jgi:uncharacterized protein (DUF433 family)